MRGRSAGTGCLALGVVQGVASALAVEQGQAPAQAATARPGPPANRKSR